MRAQPASAAVGINHQINFQGKLVNPNGTNVTDGSYSIVFSAYTVTTLGTNVWTETQTVTVTSGVFQVNLGSVTALPGTIDFNTDNIYLGVKVGADAEMTPRIQFTAVPQAFNSEKLGGLTSAGFIQNTTVQQAASNFNISGAGVVGTTLGVGTSVTSPLLQSAAAAALTITGNAASTWSTSAGNITLQAGSGTISLGSTTNLSSTGSLTITGGTSLALSSTGANSISLDSGTTGAVNIGTNANAKTITIGNITGATGVVVDCGTGSCSFGTSTTAHTTLLGTTNTTSTSTLQAGTGGVNIGTGGIANTIQIGSTTGAVAQTINIGNNATAASSNSVLIGSTIAGSTTIQNSSTINLNAGTILGTATTQNLFNTGATTVNFAGSATIVSVGATTGTTTINNNLNVASGQLTLGNDLAAPSAGSIKFNDATATNGFVTTLSTTALAAARTISLPDASGTLCLQASASCGFATSATGAAAFTQGGNSFGAAADLGTNDAFNLFLRTGGTTKLVVDTSGNAYFNQASTLGINQNATANAAGLGLTVAGGAANGSTTGNTGGSLTFLGGAAAGTGNNNGGAITIDGGAKTGTGVKGNVLLQATGGTVGIGTASPSSVYILDVNGATRFSSSLQVNGTTTLGGILAVSGEGRFDNPVYIDYTGNSANCGVNGFFTCKGLHFGNGTSGEGIGSNRAGNANPSGINLYTGYNSRLSITNTGKTGINTTNPLNFFSATPSDYSTGTAFQSGTTVTGVGTAWTSAMIGEQLVFTTGESGVITAVASGTSLTLDTTQTVSSTPGVNYEIKKIGLQVTSAGNVGIGTTSPSQTFTVVGTTQLQTPTNTTTAFQVQNSTASVIFGVDTANSRVGVGTSSPQATFNVNMNGAANADTFLIGNNTTKGLAIRDTGSAVDIETFGVSLYINNSTNQNIIIGNASNARLGVGTASPGGRLQVVSDAATTVGLIVKGAASQSADFLQIQNSAGTVVAKVDSAGNITGSNIRSSNWTNVAAGWGGDGGSQDIGTNFYNISNKWCTAVGASYFNGGSTYARNVTVNFPVVPNIVGVGPAVAGGNTEDIRSRGSVVGTWRGYFGGTSITGTLVGAYQYGWTAYLVDTSGNFVNFSPAVGYTILMNYSYPCN